jgi:hypothetical protein
MSTVMEDGHGAMTKSNCGTRQGRSRKTHKPLDIIFTEKGLTRGRVLDNKKPTITIDNNFPFLRSRVASPATNSIYVESVPMTRDGISTRGYDILSSRGMPRMQTGIPLTTIVQSNYNMSSAIPNSTRASSRTAYKYNLSGRSIKGAGALGRSDSPASHSGMDPNLPRGKSSQLNFEMIATEEQIDNIGKSLKKLRDIRMNSMKPTQITKPPLIKKANRMNF